jgi:hypothetical protein
MASYTNCKVGEVMATSGGDELRYGFGILSERGRPLLFLAFKTRDDAAQARAEVVNAVAKAVEITPGD